MPPAADARPRSGAVPPAGARTRRPLDTRSRAVRRRRILQRRLVALGALIVLFGALGGTAWALLGDDGGTGAGGDSANGQGDSQAAAAGAAAASSPSPSPSPSTPPARPKVIEIGWVGDTTPGSQYGNPPDNGRALFANVRDQLSKPDLMIANIEGTYSTATTSKGSGPNTFSFQAPPAYAEALVWAGIDMANLANNHTNDYLDLGLQQTREALKAVDVEYAGIPGETPIVDVKGVKVAVLGFSPYPWNNDINNIAGAKKLVTKADKDADLVIVTMHAGAEGADLVHTPQGSEFAYGENRGDSRAFSHACIDAGADLVLGSGPHVIRGIERYKDRLIAYSLGNFGGWGNFGTGGNLSLSGILTVRIDSTGEIRGGRWLSVYLYEPGVPSVDGSNQAANLVRQLSADDFEDTYELDAKGRFSGD